MQECNLSNNSNTGRQNTLSQEAYILNGKKKSRAVNNL